jgi:hypothetical protein
VRSATNSIARWFSDCENVKRTVITREV